jgi:hypothetical protein
MAQPLLVATTDTLYALSEVTIPPIFWLLSKVEPDPTKQQKIHIAPPKFLELNYLALISFSRLLFCTLTSRKQFAGIVT